MIISTSICSTQRRSNDTVAKQVHHDNKGDQGTERNKVMYDGLVEMSCGRGDNIFVSEDEVQDFQLNGYWVVSYPG